MWQRKTYKNKKYYANNKKKLNVPQYHLDINIQLDSDLDLNLI